MLHLMRKRCICRSVASCAAVETVDNYRADMSSEPCCIRTTLSSGSWALRASEMATPKQHQPASSNQMHRLAETDGLTYQTCTEDGVLFHKTVFHFYSRPNSIPTSHTRKYTQNTCLVVTCGVRSFVDRALGSSTFPRFFRLGSFGLFSSCVAQKRT
jgi:hypothetical protein